jgi:hypothetical protein
MPGAATAGEPGVGGPRPVAGAMPGKPVGDGVAGPGDGEAPRSGAVAGGLAAEEEAMAAEAGITSRPAMSGMAGPMMGGHGGHGDQDAEHTRRFMVDEDGETRFGTDEKTPPPVIGETAAEQAARYARDAARHRHDY